MSSPLITTYRPGQEFPSATHNVCKSCKAYCCTAEFGWHVVSLTDADRADPKLMKILEDAGAFEPNAETLRVFKDDTLALYDRSRFFFDEKGCRLLDAAGRCSIYSIRPTACRNVVCFGQAFYHEKGPVITRCDPWMKHMEKHGLAHRDNGGNTQKQVTAKDKAILDFYNLRVTVLRPVNSPPQFLATYEIAGVRYMCRAIALIPDELASVVRNRLTFNNTWMAYQKELWRIDESSWIKAQPVCDEAVQIADPESAIGVPAE